VTIEKHGLSIGIERVDNAILLALKAVGILTHQDYDIIVRMIESAMAGVEEPNLKALFDAIEFDGWEMRVAWDDLNLVLNTAVNSQKSSSSVTKNGKNWRLKPIIVKLVYFFTFFIISFISSITIAGSE
jgi:hypothetical protein